MQDILYGPEHTMCNFERIISKGKETFLRLKKLGTGNQRQIVIFRTFPMDLGIC